MAIKAGGAIFAFKLKNPAGDEAAWHIDLKETGEVARGEAPPGKKADVTLSLSDEDFGKMVSGKAKAQNLFMSGKLKVKGNVMKGEFWNIDVMKMGEANVDGEQRRRWSPYWQRQRQRRSCRGWRRYMKCCAYSLASPVT